MKTNNGRKGFTLVELLVVIIIIGILAGTMMLSMGSTTGKAEASKIVSDLRTLKTACLLYFIDHNSWPADANATGDALDNLLGGYIGGKKFKDLVYTYEVANSATNTGELFVGVGNVGPSISQDVMNSLVLQAKEVGLYGDANSKDLATTDKKVYMFVK